LTITTSNTIKGRDLALHLAQHPKPSESSKNDENDLLALFFVENQSLNPVEHSQYKDIIYYLQYQKCPGYLESHQRRRLHLETSKYLILGNSLFLVDLLMGYYYDVLMMLEPKNIETKYMDQQI
jgi:hypothetical protein